ncbi:MAG: hypothetical protein K8T26_11890 [Lentisphaerae bacterium]|nr:hypothetical protein [Lentisphaerota bacterium]
MKINASFVVALFGLCLITASTAQAEPRGSSNLGREYLVGSSDNSGWVCGMFYHARERRVEVSDVPGTLDDKKTAVYVGHTLLPWMSLYGIAGITDSSFTTVLPSKSDEAFLYGASMNLDLFTHEIQDPVLMENQIRVNGNLTYYGSQTEVFGEQQALQDVLASLTASVVNDLNGVSLYMPESIALFGGPIYSASLSNDVDDGRDDQFGLTGGIEVYQTKRVSYYFRIEEFAKVGYAGGLNVRF